MGNYANQLRQRIGEKDRAKQRAAKELAELAQAGVVRHPHHYRSTPLSGKGLVWGGECNRNGCETRPARAYNRETYAYYCTPCGRGMNQFSQQDNGVFVCVAVDHQQSMEEMNAHHVNLREEMKNHVRKN